MDIKSKVNLVSFSFSFSRIVDNVMRLIDDAKTLERAGCFAFVIECVRF